ncbi:hypothetical protein C8R44DRAFT_145519 [Mycena epipterygia]|nr:hypothetical protein C8R44DRAFT_145519 [Mycena epipterygia]
MRIGTPFILLASLLASGVLAAPLDGDRNHGLVAKAVKSGAKSTPVATTKKSVSPPASKSAAPLPRSSAVVPVRSSAPPSGKSSAVAKPSSKSVTPPASKSAAPLSRSSALGPVPSSAKSAAPSGKSSALSAKPASASGSPSIVASRSSAALPSSANLSAPSGIPSALSAKPSSATGSPSVVASSAKVSASSIKGSSVASGPSSVVSAPASPSGSASSNNIPGPLACPVASKPSASSTKRGSSLAVHARSGAPSTASASGCQTPETCLAKGQGIWNSINAATADTSKDKTTTKFAASYPQIFSAKGSVNQDISTSTDDTAKEIMSLFNKKTFDDEGNAADLENPLFPGLATTMKRVANADEDAYEFVFAPGVIVAVRSYKNMDPVTPAANQVNWDIIAMELYKQYKGSAPPTDLRFIMRFHIANAVSSLILEQIYKNGGLEDQLTSEDTDWVKWDANDAHCGQNAVLTMLGTNNGSGAGYLLIDYHTTLGGKKLKYMYTRRQDDMWAMVTEYA